MEVIIMKKANIERIIAKLENIGICLNAELDRIENNGHSSGMYNKNDLQRIIDYAGSTIRTTKNIDNKTAVAHIQYLCVYVASASKQITDVIDNEEV